MKVLNFYKEGLKIPDNAIYIGRKSYKHNLPESKYHNPFKLSEGEAREATIERYRQYLWKEVRSGNITVEELASLYGKDLVCYCAPNPCHGDVLLSAIKWAKDKIKE